ncbi:DUF4410 domain-containing protein [Coralloluteibacterium stylophorae]|uniref:DUF4410 domain-containing protein n=1 Tax=Coralloluteibacterium stylophorae TaxID=1776034 RepID=A0A8J8AZ42_9GAMM|nr:DUF4410 domain-containing protein [Coralloluteibacterium stylophorae]MBS7456989.1 DUF4410 domain-containing protein [Coralloluteibacterium stylophorae]
MKWSLLLASLFLVLAACSTSSQVRTAYAPTAGDRFSYAIDNAGGMSTEALGIFRARLDSQLAARGLLAQGGGDRRIAIRIDEYRMRHGAARGLLGVMAGTDSILSTVTVTDADGRVLGQMQVDSGNATAMGTATGMIETHADEVVAFVSGAPAS